MRRDEWIEPQLPFGIALRMFAMLATKDLRFGYLRAQGFYLISTIQLT